VGLVYPSIESKLFIRLNGLNKKGAITNNAPFVLFKKMFIALKIKVNRQVA